MADIGEWIAAEIHEQKKFVFGFACMFFAIGLKKLRILKAADAPAVSKVAFNLMFPALLFSGIYKIELQPGLTEVVLSSMLFHALQVVIVFGLSYRQPLRDGIRGQWIMCTQGTSMGIAYPFLLGSEALRREIFPRFVMWDFGGNIAVGMVINLIVAMTMAPSKQQEARLEESPTTAAVETPSPAKDLVEACNKSLEEGLHEVLGVSMDPLAPSAQADGDGPLSLSTLKSEQAIVEAMAMDGGGAQSRRSSRRVSVPRLEDLQQGFGVLSVIGKRVAMNLPFLAQLAGFTCKLGGVTVPDIVIEFCETISVSYGLLLFFIIGMNFEWHLIRPHVAQVFKALASRYSIYALLGGLIALLPIMTDTASKQTLLLYCACPVSGVSMAYVLDYGYNSSMQAAILIVSNVISFSCLWVLIAMYS